MNLFTSQMLTVLQLALDDDFCALFASLSNSVGTSGVDLTVANMLSAQQGLRTRGANADAVIYVLDNQQALDLDTALVSASAATATFALSADRLIGYAPTADHGMGPSRQISSFRGFPVIATGLTDTANAAADVVGSCYCPTSAYNDASGATTFGIVWKRLPRFETQRQAKSRGTDLVMTMRAGTAVLQVGSGAIFSTVAYSSFGFCRGEYQCKTTSNTSLAPMAASSRLSPRARSPRTAGASRPRKTGTLPLLSKPSARSSKASN
jgi:hypothetical protein